MFRLRLLGTPHLEGNAGIVQQGPRRIAILAALAASGPAGLTRDKLIALLWPEGEDERSRRNLSQLLYAMRTELGAIWSRARARCASHAAPATLM